MSKRISLSLIVLLLIYSIGCAQQALVSKSDRVDEAAYASFLEGDYQKVIQQYHGTLPRAADDQILYHISRLKTGENTSEEMEQWIMAYPATPRAPLARFHLGEYYFYNGDSTLAYDHLRKVRFGELSLQNQLSYSYAVAHLQLQKKNYSSAKKFFDFVEKNQLDSSFQIAYYQGFIDYHLQNTTRAIAYLQKAAQISSFQTSAYYLIAKIYLAEEDYARVVELASGQLSDDTTRVNAALHQLLGEAHALSGDVLKADRYFTKALHLYPQRPPASLFYQAGIAKFKGNREDEAIQYFIEAGTGSGDYAQLSALQLGRIYVRKEDFEKAATAYQEAASASSDEIQEEATFQSAKLNAKLGRYTEAINYANDYLKSFPKGEDKREIEELIAETYLRTSDYDLAIEYLERLGIEGAKQQAVYQKVTFQKGILYYNDGDFKTAKEWILKSLRFPIDLSTSNQSYFYLAEILNQSGQYAAAISSYLKQTRLDGMSNYGLGYAHFNLRQYEKAIPYFRAVREVSAPFIMADAKLRLADCLYASKRYEQALRMYRQIEETDYVRFQQGMIHKKLDQYPYATNAWERVRSQSSWKDDAIYHLGLFTLEKGYFEKATGYFDQLIQTYPKSSYSSKAYLNRATALVNSASYPQAVQDYERVISDYIQSEEAFSAILGLQEVGKKGVKTGNIDAYIAQYKKMNPESGSLEVVEFESAKSDYFSLAYSKAIPKLAAFIKNYPESKYKPETEYYLGDAYYRTNQMESAFEVYEKQKFVQNNFTGRILNRLGLIAFELENYPKAIESYEMLVRLNLSERDNFNGQKGLMNSHYASQQYEETISYADDVIRSVRSAENTKRQATYLKAKSYLQLDNVEEATKQLKLLEEGTDQLAAEAAYLLSSMMLSKGESEEVLEVLFANVDKHGAYAEWVEKSYLLIAEAYIMEDDLFQAKATLRSILQHGQHEPVLAAARSRLGQIEGTMSLDTLKE